MGIRNGDEVVVVVLMGHVPSQVEMMGLMMVRAGVNQAKYMVLRVSW